MLHAHEKYTTARRSGGGVGAMPFPMQPFCPTAGRRAVRVEMSRLVEQSNAELCHHCGKVRME